MTNHRSTISRKQRQFSPSLKLLTLTLGFLLSAFAIAMTNSMIAIVNDDVITFDAIAKQIKPSSTKAQKIALVNQQIDLVLQLKQIEKIGIRPKPKAIDVMLSRIASQNKLTSAQLKASPEFDTIVENITQRLALGGLKQFVLSNIEVNLTQSEIDAAIAKNRAKDSDFGKQIKIAQILVNSIEKTDANANALTQSQDSLIKQFLTQLTDKINNGAPFASLAKLHSQDPSYKNGGESGWLNPNELSAVIQQQLAGLKLTQVSKPFVTKKGWRIIKITKQRNDITSQLSNIKKQLIQSQKNDYFKDWVKKLRKNVYIEIFEHKL